MTHRASLGIGSLCALLAAMAWTSPAWADEPPQPEPSQARGGPAKAQSVPTATFVPKRDLVAVPASAMPGPSDDAVEVPIGPQTITMRPGVNEIIPVAVSQTNRIITPFREAEVVTASQTQPEVRGGVLYLAPPDTNIITLYVTEKGSEAVALSLTLVPRQIPPRELRLDLTKEDRLALVEAVPSKGNPGEANEPYIQSLLDAMRAVALERTPVGYELRGLLADDRLPSCRMEGLRVSFAGGQVLVGGRTELIVGRVANPGALPVELNEAACADRDVIAVASWPSPRLEAGASSELYVLRRRVLADETAAQRPVLVGANP